MTLPARLFLDCTHTYLSPEYATGIQRVIRQVMARSTTCAPRDVACIPIFYYQGSWLRACASGGPRRLLQLSLERHALRHKRKALKVSAPGRLSTLVKAFVLRLSQAVVSFKILLLKTTLNNSSQRIEPAAGDSLLLMEFPNAERHELITRAQDAGVRMVALVYDLIPLKKPSYFINPENFIKWFDWISVNANRVITISASVAEEFSDAYPSTASKVHPFHLGGDFVAPLDFSAPPLPPGYFLMVGTIEPRKGYQVVLDAFERLWSDGVNVSLVIVGRPGWLTDQLMVRLVSHKEKGRRLLWMNDANDAQLEAAYRGAKALIAASEAEGFGLPLVEAMLRGVPVFASDLPVFREVGGNLVDYFPPKDAVALAKLVRSRAEQPRKDVSGFCWISWDESARQLLRLASETN